MIPPHFRVPFSTTPLYHHSSLDLITSFGEMPMEPVSDQQPPLPPLPPHHKRCDVGCRMIESWSKRSISDNY